jgi:hypothetical protein
MCSARDGVATRGGGSGGDAAERADDAAARLGNSGEGFRVLGCVGTATSDASGSSPPGADLGRLHDDETAMTAREHSGGG